MVEIFTKAEFERVLGTIADWKSLGEVQHNEAYEIDFGNEDARILVYSSIDKTGRSRQSGEDSIRIWLVTPDHRPIGGKTQSHVKRTKSWRESLRRVIREVANLGRWIQPCPKCGQMLGLKVKKQQVFVFCPHDAENRHESRHLELIVLDKKTGEQT